MTDPIRIPAESCYWVRLPPGQRSWSRQRLLAAIEPFVPHEIDNLDIAWALGADRQLLAACVEPTVLEAALAAHPEAWSAIPDRIPAHVAVDGLTVTDCEFLTGERTPMRLRRIKTGLLVTIPVLAATIIILLLVGFWRRNAEFDHVRRLADDDGGRALASVLPAALAGSDPDPLIRLDQAQRLAGALRRAADGTAGNAAALHASLLSAWPADAQVQVGTMAIDGSRATITGVAASVDEAQRLATRLAAGLPAGSGWRILPLQASNNGASATFTCTLVRDGG